MVDLSFSFTPPLKNRMATSNNDFRIRRASASVLVAKAEPFSCEVLGTLLQREGFDVVGRASQLDDLIQQIHNKKPRCVIADTYIIGAHTDKMVKELMGVSKPPNLSCTLVRTTPSTSAKL